MMNCKIKENPSTSFRATSIEWKGTQYHRSLLPGLDLCEFICFWLFHFPKDHFYMTVEGKTFRVVIRKEGPYYLAIVPDYYDGEGDNLWLNSSENSREEALRGLAEQISERLLAEMI